MRSRGIRGWLAIATVAAAASASEVAAQLRLAADADEASPPASAQSADGGDVAAAPADSERPRVGRIELKRQDTGRGSSEETTQTILRLERFFSGTLNLLRLDLPFPDANTSLGGSPFNPRLGDIKLRLGFQAVEHSGYSFPTFIEITFPTANPETLGAGQYQVSAGIRMLHSLVLPGAGPASHKSQFEFLAQEVNGVGGNATQENISYAKFELTLSDIWRQRYTFDVKLKPAVDWTQGGQSSAVLEIEGGLLFARNWRTWLMLGGRVWGSTGVPSTYDERIEIGIARTF